MNNDDTKDLNENEKLDTRPLIERAIREMIETRESLLAELGKVEAKLSAELFEVKSRLDGVEKELRLINRRLDIFAVDINKIRGEMWELDNRLDEVERRPH